MKKSSINSSKIGKEFSLFYFYIFNNNSFLSANKMQSINIKSSTYSLINTLNIDFNLKYKNRTIYNLDLNNFINLFNKKLFKLPVNIIFSFLRGYYFNNLMLYSTNIQLNKNENENENRIIQNKNLSLYFVLYDFHDKYLNYIYNFIINKVKFNPKIKFLIHNGIDKYSINELTDNTPYKMVFLHKSKYYNNIIYQLLFYLFNDSKYHYLYKNNNLNEIFNSYEHHVYNIYNSFKY